MVKKVEVLNRDGSISIGSMNEYCIERTQYKDTGYWQDVVLMRVIPETKEEIEAEANMPF